MFFASLVVLESLASFPLSAVLCPCSPGPLGTTKLYWGIKDRGLADAVKSMIVGDSKDGEKGDETNWGHVESHVTIGSRMNIRQVLSEELENAPGGTIVVVCGPHAMCDEARYACAGLARHGAKVRYVEESFSW